MKTRLATIALVLCLVASGTPPYRVYLPFVARENSMAIGYEIITADGVTVDLTIAGINVNPGIPDGFGLPPVAHIAKTVYGLPGGVLDSINIGARVVTLTCSMTAASQEALHAVRKILWAPLRWNRTTVNPPQPARLRYTANSKSVDLYVHYLADVTGNAGAANNLQLVGIRLIAYDPIWYDDAAASAGLSVGQLLAVEYIVGKINEAWSAMGGDSGTCTVVRAIAASPDGTRVYIGGGFTGWAADANANYIAMYTVSTGLWSALETGMSIGVGTPAVYAIAVAPDGTVYVGGEFDTAGTTSANRIARYNPVSNTWSALDTGVDDTVYSIAISPSGIVYVGGAFADKGSRVAYWDSIASTWTSMSASTNNEVNALALAPDGTLYAGGTFTTIGGVVARVAKWVSGTTWAVLGAGVNGSVYALTIGKNGMMYAGGIFTTAGGIAALRVAQWNGTAWSALGTGVNDGVRSLAILSDGTLIAGGSFTSAGGITLSDRVAVWNGTAWSHLDIDLPSTPYVYAISSFDMDVYFGFDTAGDAFLSSTASITNSGTFDARPVFTVTGPGTLSWIENVTTGKRMIFNCYLNAGETATITPKLATFTSDWRGDLLPYAVLLPQSDFGDFALAPAPIAAAGVNSIAVMMTGTTPVVQNDNAGTASAAQLDDWEDITGVDCDNTDSGGRMYASIVVEAPGYRVDLYDDSARTHLVGHTNSYNAPTDPLDIMANDGSGLGGHIQVLEANAVDTDIVVFFATVCESHYDAYLTADDGV